MTAFYLLPTGVTLLASMAAGLCIIAQTTALVYSLARSHLHKPLRWLEDALQIAVLVEVLVFAYCVSVIREGTASEYVYLPGHAVLRYAVFAVMSLLAAAVSLSCKRAYPLLTVIAGMPVLPIAESTLSGSFIWLYGASLLFFTVRAAHLVLLWRKEFETELSAFSVMAAVDALHSGVLFCEPSGYILLCNRRMRFLMLAVAGRIYRNAKQFWACISEHQSGGGEKLNAQGACVYRLSDGSVWMFTRCDISDNSRHYVQISAADITEGWQTTERLKQQNTELGLRSEELKALLTDIRLSVLETETLRMRSALHEVLGQRLALLLHAFREGVEPNDEVLAAFADGLPLETAPQQGAASSRIKTVKKLMSDIGVTLVMNGDYPNESSAQEVCADIITEAVTNSVRHGFASEVKVDMHRGDETFIMRISDNGVYQAGGSFTEGSGIKTMRRKLSEIGGCLDIMTEPRFALSVTIPKGASADD